VTQTLLSLEYSKNLQGMWCQFNYHVYTIFKTLPVVSDALLTGGRKKGRITEKI